MALQKIELYIFIHIVNGIPRLPRYDFLKFVEDSKGLYFLNSWIQKSIDFSKNYCVFFLSWEKTSSSSCNVGHCHKCTYTQIHIWHTVVLSKRFSFISKPLRDWQVLWLMEYCKIEQSYVFNKMTLGLFVATSTSKQLWFGNGCSTYTIVSKFNSLSCCVKFTTPETRFSEPRFIEILDLMNKALFCNIQT